MPNEVKVIYEDVTDRTIEEELKKQREMFWLDTRKKKEEEKVKAKQRSEKIKRELANVDKRVNELRCYTFASLCGIAAFEGLEVRDILRPGGLRIGLFGPAGSGKSSFISTCEKTIKKKFRGSADVKTEGGEGTVRVMDYVSGGWHFKLIDTRGFGSYGRKEIAAFKNLITGTIKIGQEINFTTEQSSDIMQGKIKNRMHQVVFVISGTDPRLLKGDLTFYFNPMREIMRPNGLAAVTVITHLDEIEKKGLDLDTIKESASRATGCDLAKLFFIKNYFADEDRDPDIENATCDVLECALRMGERYVRITKNREKRAAARQDEDKAEGETLEAMFQNYSQHCPCRQRKPTKFGLNWTAQEYVHHCL
ncbi:interferon-induced protein 44-like [Ptychodera flava]|uniref:interferon-induced protein 44-like n=1 Tax=Ptychodera flava TaxID=63121 RepID=UPI003969D66D